MEVLPVNRSLTVAAQNDAPRGGKKDESAKIRDAAAQFEALLLAQILKSVQEAASEGWLGTGQDEAGGLMLEVAQEHLAQVLASQGGLGLAKLVVEGLSRKP